MDMEILLITIGIVQVVVIMGVVVTLERVIDEKMEAVQERFLDSHSKVINAITNTEDKLIRELEESEQSIVFENVDQRRIATAELKELIDDTRYKLLKAINIGVRYNVDKFKSTIEGNAQVLEEVCISKDELIKKLDAQVDLNMVNLKEFKNGLSGMIERECQKQMFRYIMHEVLFNNKKLKSEK